MTPVPRLGLMNDKRPNLDDELQTADDALVEDAAILQEIEEERRDASVADPVQIDLSEIAADTARELRDDARRQRDLSEKLVEDYKRPRSPSSHHDLGSIIPACHGALPEHRFLHTSLMTRTG